MKYSIFAILTLSILITGCPTKKTDNDGTGAKEVVLYCSSDPIFVKDILAEFEKTTGIKVIRKHDDEKKRGRGMRELIQEEKDNPKADVYWNNEIINTLILKADGLLQPYDSPSAKGLAATYVDKDKMWTAFGARARVFIINKKLIPDPANYPKSIHDYLDPKWKGKCAIAKPIAGTCATQFAAMWTVWGEEKVKDFFNKMKQNDVHFLSGNGYLMSAVGNGEFAWGYTDTNDANIALVVKKHPVKVLFPDQGENHDGTVVIPHSVSILKGAKHLENAKKLYDFICSKANEERLAASKSRQIPLHEGSKIPEDVHPDLKEYLDIKKIKVFKGLDFEKAAKVYGVVTQWVHDELAK